MTKTVRLPDAFLAWASAQPDEGCIGSGGGPPPEQQRDNKGTTMEQHREAAVSALLEVRRAWADTALSTAERDFLRAEELRLCDEICRLTSQRLPVTTTATLAKASEELPDELVDVLGALSDVERSFGGAGMILDRMRSHRKSNGTWILSLAPLALDCATERMAKLEYLIAHLCQCEAA
jgi:hypothetical protein